MPKTLFLTKSSFVGLFLLFGFACVIASCSNNGSQAPDVAHVNVQLKSQRLDRDLRALDTNRLAEGLNGLKTQYPVFLNFYLDTIMGFNIQGDYSDTNLGIKEGLKSFLTYKDYVNLFDTVANHYPKTDDLEKDLQKGFQYLKHYYPKFQEPRIVYFISGLMNWGVVSYEGILGIGLDMFLGPQYPFYAAVGQPGYMYINFRKASIAPSVFSTIYNDFHPFQDEERTLLDMMIQKGKQQYFVEKMLPWISLEDRIGYTATQLKWCEDNEALIYNFFLSQNLMFEKNWNKMRRYVVYGPTSSGMPAESPGNIGTWLGLQIVKAYVQQNPNADLETIFNDVDAEQFLKKAKYKPR